MLNRIRDPRRLASILVLAVFAAWMGAAAFHHHPSSAPCEVCKALHATHAAVPPAAPAPQPAVTAREISPAALSAPPEPPQLCPKSRAPPLA